jgi:uncharacterized membrane protein
MRLPRPTTLLTASIALNLFLASALGVVLYRQHQTAPAVAPTMGSAVEGLTPAHQAAFRAMLHGEAIKLKPTMKAAKLARRDAARLFIEPQMDRASVLAALQTARTNEDGARADLEEQVVDFAGQLSAEERKTLAVMVRRGVKTNRRVLGAAGAPTQVGKRNLGPEEPSR